MRPPYDVTPTILKLIASIAQKIGAVSAKQLVQQHPQLRKQNRIKTIHASLGIEGNTLSEAQITAIIENKRVAGPEKDIKEVVNALEVYKQLKTFKYNSEKDFLKAHQLLLQGLITNAGQYRKKGVGIVKGAKVTHIAPPAANLKFLMCALFKYLNNNTELTLIKSCVFHYELEFIHPFMDGNGRMGRLWQTLILMNEYPLFEFLPFETLISKQQDDYYRALSNADKEGKSTQFIEFMLSIIDTSLNELLVHATKRLNETERLELFLENNTREFARKDYRKHYTEISSATASRDLENGYKMGLLARFGVGKTTYYKKK